MNLLRVTCSGALTVHIHSDLTRRTDREKDTRREREGPLDTGISNIQPVFFNVADVQFSKQNSFQWTNIFER